MRWQLHEQQNYSLYGSFLLQNFCNVHLLQADGAPDRMEEIHSYFRSQWQGSDQAADQRASARQPGSSGIDASHEDVDDHLKITWDQGDWQAAEGLRARCHAAAVLANAAADVSAPLVTATDLRVRNENQSESYPNL